jgi:hypothetical protein
MTACIEPPLTLSKTAAARFGWAEPGQRNLDGEDDESDRWMPLRADHV